MMMDKYMYLFFGIILGAAIIVLLWVSKEEKIENTIRNNQKVFSTSKLDKTMEMIVEKIKYKISEAKRELTEDEKNEIIENCLKQNFVVNKN